jgi:hypothetical protein
VQGVEGKSFRRVEVEVEVEVEVKVKVKVKVKVEVEKSRSRSRSRSRLRFSGLSGMGDVPGSEFRGAGYQRFGIILGCKSQPLNCSLSPLFSMCYSFMIFKFQVLPSFLISMMR